MAYPCTVPSTVPSAHVPNAEIDKNKTNLQIFFTQSLILNYYQNYFKPEIAVFVSQFQ